MAGEVAPGAVGTLVGIGRRNATVARDAQDLAEQDVPVARRVVVVLAVARIGVIAATIANADVEVAVVAKMQVARILVSCGRGNILDENLVEPRDVVVGKGVALNRVGAFAGPV